MSELKEKQSQKSNLSPSKLSLLEKWKRGKYTGGESAAIPRREARGPVALSFVQQRLWFLHNMKPDSPAYNECFATRFEGELDVIALEDSLNEVLRRHEILRTTFSVFDAEPAQVINDQVKCNLILVDLRELPEDRRKAEADTFINQEARQPFDFTEAPLLRAKLLRMGQQEHILVLTLHHILIDGWSLSILIREIAALYEAFSINLPSPLPELPIQYSDYAVWQRQWVQGKAFDSHLQYWKQQLEGNLPLLQLPSDRPRPAVQSFRGATERFLIPANSAASLKAFSSRQSATLFMTLLAAFDVLLSRYSGQQDILVGSPVANRNHAEVEPLIGCFINMLILRARFSGDPTFEQLLALVREMTLEAFAHQDIPVEKLLKELHPDQGVSVSSLFQVSFVLQNVPLPPLELRGLTAEPLIIDNGTAKFDLKLDITEASDSLIGSIEYSTDLFDATTIKRMVGHLQSLLESIITNPDARISDLKLLTAAERHQLLNEWNDTKADYPGDVCIHELFEAQVERTPDAVAVIYEGQQLTYAELNGRANQLARHLVKLGLGPEALACICVERSPEMIVAMFGVLKAGGGYVPLDPSYPKERLAFIVEETEAVAVLTQERLKEKLGDLKAGVISLDSDWEVIERESARNLPDRATPDNLAYVIYTSGSTGKPKGAMLPHRGISNRIIWQVLGYPLTGDAVVLQQIPLTFDPSVTEIYSPLSCGATLVLPRHGGQQDSKYIAELIRDEKVTDAFFVPSMLQSFVEEESVREIESLRRVESAGEVLTVELERRFFERLKADLYNFYGPTETSVSVIYYGCKRDEETRVVPIGRPTANVKIYVLDEKQNPVPIGVAGELHIGGMAPGRGYLKRADLTAEKFIPDEFSREQGGRLYRTGDLVRYLADGNIEFLGRIDYQVKIRGQRVELGEIESALNEHEAVRESVVVAREDTPGDMRLIAYVATQLDPSACSNELRAYLKQRLPKYMVPSYFVPLDHFPLTSNGKVDRAKLPLPDGSLDELKAGHQAPRTPVEQIIAGIFTHLLGVKQPDIYDSFFDLGGHSLLAAQVSSRLREAFNVDIPLRKVFELQTVAGLAMSVESTMKGSRLLQPVHIRKNSLSGELIPSFAHHSIWIFDQMEPGSPAYNIAASIKITGKLDAQVTEASFNEIVRRHEVLRSRFKKVEGRMVWTIAPEMMIELAVQDLRQLPAQEREREAERLAAEEASKPFDLSEGPLLRTKLLRLDEQEYRLLVVMHHIVSDGWSLAIFVREFAALYEAFFKGEPSPLPELQYQYLDYSEWQRQCFDDGLLDDQLSYWERQLKGDLPMLQLPSDRPRPPRQTFRGAVERFLVPADITAALNALSRRESATLFMSLLSVFNVLLYFYTGQEDILVGSPIANRNQPEFEALIGCFINMLVLRTSLSRDMSFEELLADTREVTLEAYAHQDIPFVKLVEELEPDRDPTYGSMFQVSFVLQNVSMPPLNLPGLTAIPSAIDNGTAKFDLKLDITEEPHGLNGFIEYNTDLFDATTIKSMVGHFQALLEGVIATPDARISDLKLLTAAERHQLLIEWNDTKVDYPTDVCIHQLFEAQVERTPHSVAVIYEDEQLTYAQLNARANQLAHHLTELGVKPETLTGICLERSLEMIVAILGVLKAGGAYVPLDPSFPKERLAFMLEDTQAAVLLTQQRLSDKLDDSNAHVICLDSDWETVARRSEQNLPNRATPDNLAYVIYTSGSTGNPKGAMLIHRGVCNRIIWQIKGYPLTEDAVVLQQIPLTFDPSVTEIYPPLSCGARLVLARDGGQRDSAYIANLIGQKKITDAFFVPSMLQSFVEEEAVKDIDSLRRVESAGETLTLDLERRFFERLKADIYNFYGPTETSVSMMYYPCKRDEDRRLIPIGRPTANVEIYVLDANLRPVPVGVPGEMHIGGTAPGRGYLNRPDLTAEKFIPNEFNGRAGARLYKTGDLVRYLHDGNIEFLGRIDTQVKIRGYRVELGEIEETIEKHPAVRQAVILAREDAEGEKRLVAYVVAGEGQALTTSEMRGYIKEKLPDYMVPSAFVMLDEMPLTSNGKIDRRALPAPPMTRPELEEEYVAPRTPAEKTLAEIWAQVLGVDLVGIHDNFFALGGDSIRIVRVLGLAKQSGVDISLEHMFEHETIADLTRELRLDDATYLAPPQIAPFGLISEQRRQALPDYVEDAYPLSMLQAGMVFHSLYDPSSAVYHDLFSAHLRAPLDLAAFRLAAQQLSANHPILRTWFDLSNFADPIQLVNKASHLPVSVDDLRHLSTADQEKEVTAWIEAEKKHPFDWSTPPLIRIQIHLRGDETFQFSLSFHHSILDGWSVSALIRELFELHESLIRDGSQPFVSAPQELFRDYIALERSALESEEARRFWVNKLNDAQSTLMPRLPSVQEDARSVIVHQIPIPPEVSEGLKNLAASAGVPLKSVLLAAHMKVLSVLSGQSEVITGIISDGRPEASDAHRILGLYLNTLPLRIKLEGGTWKDLAVRTFDAEREVLPFRRYPIAEIQRAVGGQPLFDVVFNFVHFHVYRDILSAKDRRVLGAQSYEETNFAIMANFAQDFETSQVTLNCEYDITSFSPDQMENISGYYAKALEAMAKSADSRYEFSSLLSPAEQQTLIEWNDTRVDYPHNLCITDLFEAQVERTPDAVAIVFEDEQLTYGNLNRRANQLARYLMELGVGPEVRVGIMVERTIELPIALLGILKAGGAYVPLDPKYPAERLSMMIEDAELKVLITENHLAERAPDFQKTLICLDSAGSEINRNSSENPGVRVAPENIAYVIYTSGSTGRPKGVSLEHRSVVALLHWARDFFDPGDLDTVLFSTSICFDLSVFELFVPLSWGGSVVIAENLMQAMNLPPRRSLTLINTVPSVLSAMMQVAKIPDSVRTMTMGGEALGRELAQRIYEQSNVKRVFNHYGPTEDTVYSMFALINEGESGPVTIGWPISNSQLYILNEWMQPVPTGVLGELYIGGAGLARGYFNRPEITAERFLPSPLSSQPGARLYRTGDIGRFHADGSIEYAGRIDNQVKIRGFRIELGEIENVLRQHEAVREAAVVARDQGSGSKRLEAYVVLKTGSEATFEELRSHMRKSLPEYMVASIIVLLESLPLTSNGKINRAALFKLNGHDHTPATNYVAPSTQVEQSIAAVWQDVLKIDRAGTQDNFFDLGGHSLLMVEVQSKLRTQLNRDVSLVELFKYPTIGLLTEYLGEQVAEGNQQRREKTVERLAGGKGRMKQLYQRGQKQSQQRNSDEQ